MSQHEGHSVLLLNGLLTRIDGATNNSAQRVPCHIIKPVVEGIEPLLNQILGSSVVKVGVKLVNDAFIPQHREETRGKC